MKKLLFFCMAIFLAVAPTSSVCAASVEPLTIITENDQKLVIESIDGIGIGSIAEESFRLSTDSTSMTTTITMEYQGEVIPARSVNITRILGDKTYTGTVYLKTFRYLDGVTSATYEGTLYLQSSTS